MYTRFVLPRLIEWACSQPQGMEKRKTLIPMALGRVLEVGIGSGMNLPFYDASRVVHLTGIDPMERLWNRNKLDVSSLGFELVYLRDSAEQLPFENESFDTLVSTMFRGWRDLLDLCQLIVPESEVACLYSLLHETKGNDKRKEIRVLSRASFE